MKNAGVPIVKEGLPFLFLSLGVTFAFWFGGFPLIAFCFAGLSAFILFFFRNPERLPPVGSTLVVAPADGKVITVATVREPHFLHEPMERISIFLSLWDVHVNRVPTDATVKDIQYHKGRFMAAFDEHASEENERNALLLETQKGQKLLVVQVAGLVARRIVCYPNVGSYIMRGQRFGLIRFGSRTDIYLPKGTPLLVKVGDKVRGGETILAELNAT